MIRLLLAGAAALALAVLCRLLDSVLPGLAGLGALLAGVSLSCGLAALAMRIGLARAGALAVTFLIAGAPLVAAYAADGNAVTIPYGDYLAEGGHVAGAVLVPVILALVARLTGPAGLFLQTFLGERLVRNALDYAVNAVEGAAKGKVLSVPVGSQVLAQALQYALDNGAPWLVAKLGGAEGIRLKLFRALDLAPEASAALLTARAAPLVGRRLA